MLLKVLVCVVLVAWMCSAVLGKSIPSQLNDDGTEVEFVTGSSDSPGYPGFGPGFGGDGGRRNIFRDWMKWIQGFFKEGQWDNGGPSNFGQFLGSQIGRLIEMLTKDGGLFNRK